MRAANHSGRKSASTRTAHAVSAPAAMSPTTADPPSIPRPGAICLPFCVISAFASAISCRTSSDRSRVSSPATSPIGRSRREADSIRSFIDMVSSPDHAAAGRGRLVRTAGRGRPVRAAGRGRPVRAAGRGGLVRAPGCRPCRRIGIPAHTAHRAGLVSPLRRCFEEPRRCQPYDETDTGDHPGPPPGELLCVAQQLVAAHPLEVTAEALHLISGHLSEMDDLLIAGALLAHLRAAVAQRLSRLAGLSAHLGRAAIERLTELASTLILQLGSLVLDLRGAPADS